VWYPICVVGLAVARPPTQSTHLNLSGLQATATTADFFAMLL
jgi:hypothetical protein